MAITFSAASGCSNNSSALCQPGEQVTLNATPLAGYSTSCGTHTYVWDFGDGSGQSTGQTVTHPFGSSQAQYTVHCTVTNNAGSTQLTQIVHVNGGPGCPAPSTSNLFLTYSAPSGCSYANTNAQCKNGESVAFGVSVNTFTGAGYTFSCGPHSFHWDFDDGSSSEEQNPSHVFSAGSTAKTFNVKCTITNPKGSVTLPMPVNVGPGGTGLPTVDFVYEPVSGVPTLVKFTPSVVPANSVSKWTWKWGDNTVDTSIDGTSPIPQYHQYAANGTYTVTLTTNAGVVVTKQVVVGVQPPPRNRPSRH
jgi:PKD repeat protein